MNPLLEKLHTEMITDIERCFEMELTEAEQVESAFKVALKYWNEAKIILTDHEFETVKEEVNFYKHEKVKFTGYIEYFMLLNNALLFIPDDRVENEKTYWEREAERMSRFLKKNYSFVDYIKKGKTEKDKQYFVQADHLPVNAVASKIYDAEERFVASHDHLVASLFAEEMYLEYVGNKLQMLQKKSSLT